MYKASDFVEACKRLVGMPYWYGTCIYPCSRSLLASKKVQYPAHYRESRMRKYESDCEKHLLAMDCVGLIKGFFWCGGLEPIISFLNGASSLSRKYGRGIPDKSANSLGPWCKRKGAQAGDIDSIPDVPGVIVHKTGHVGVYVGNGEVVEARGFDYGVVKTKLKERPWEDWYYLPESVLDYGESTAEPLPGPDEPKPDPEPDHPDEGAEITYFMYTVVSGDRLWNIAKRFYGTGYKFRIIQEDNGLKNDKIYPGDQLKIRKEGF